MLIKYHQTNRVHIKSILLLKSNNARDLQIRCILFYLYVIGQLEVNQRTLRFCVRLIGLRFRNTVKLKLHQFVTALFAVQFIVFYKFYTLDIMSFQEVTARDFSFADRVSFLEILLFKNILKRETAPSSPYDCEELSV